MDCTLSWPFMEQTIDMARNVHKYKYKLGVGSKKAEDGTLNQNYWVQVNEDKDNSKGELHTKKPYRIELVGVVCDGYLAAVRGIRRAIMTGEAVTVNSQLKSHKRFANAFPKYCELVDNARLYCTNGVGVPPQVNKNVFLLFRLILHFTTSLNCEADSIRELHKEPSPVMGPGSVWNDFVLSPARSSVLKELRESFHKIERSMR
ncbi:P-loop containing nucleoside triphosphate hydrolases superfamily protein [Trifolium medium]|uniref:P-loop containing nucleoside triphosphate hydrolases superfamily protein n=1 Tax=Trifolium medium TaxID=97028 RepID=A0A392MWM7_9FABA|nr:P-loop containing nucleoside triphosphate hydrolases superfamily protein [Trifolium medium]